MQRRRDTNADPSTIPSNVTNKPLLAAKIITFFVFGFGTPFYAVHYHL